MNVTENLPTTSHHGEIETGFTALTMGSVLETLGGTAAVVLSILGLVGIVPFYMAAIGAIAFGVGLMAEGAGSAVNSDVALHGNGTMQRSETIGGSGAELLGGLAGGILGLLALLSISPMVLLSVASIVFGAAFLLGSVSTARLSSIASSSAGHPIARESIETAAGAQVIVGLAGAGNFGRHRNHPDGSCARRARELGSGGSNHGDGDRRFFDLDFQSLST